MTYRNWVFALGIFSILCDSLAADEFPVVPQEGVLLLRNDNVIRGEITRVGDQYVVILGSNGEMRLPASSVVRQARDLDELYFARRGALDRTSVDGRLLLAQWCLRQRMFARAADQILAASLLDPADSRIDVLQQQLQVSSTREKSVSSRPATDAPSFDIRELEERIRALPVGAVEQFTHTIQPMLLNRCAGCHGLSSASKFRLLRRDGHQTMPLRFTQRNLAATFEMIDTRQPGKSPLLTKPAGPHGNMKTALFERHKSQLAMLTDWVAVVARGVPLRRPEKVAMPNSALPQSTHTIQNAREAVPRNLKDRREDIARRLNLPQVPAWVKEGSARSQSFQPRDPFDAEIFNRRHFGAAQSSRDEPSSYPGAEPLAPPASGEHAFAPSP